MEKIASNKLIVIAGAALIVVAVIGFWFWQSRALFPSQPPTVNVAQTPSTTLENKTAAVSNSLGGQIFQKTVNPVANKIPDANPFNKVETNPLKQIYKNPF